MSFTQNFPDTSQELIFQRWKSGIRLARPDRFSHSTACGSFSVANLLDMPFSIFIHDLQTVVRYSNVQHSTIMGFSSTQKALGKSVFDFTCDKSARLLRENDLHALRSEQSNIIEEDVFVTNGKGAVTTLSIKVPLYQAEKVSGVFGCAIDMHTHDLANSLSTIVKLGLLHTPVNKSMSRTIYGVNYTKREIDILRLLIRGKTAVLIAEALHLSKRTVEHYLDTIKSKANAGNKTELIDLMIDYLQ